MVSIKDVAKYAGVAISTVSKVLNHYPNVSEEMKLKVNRAVEELSFVPNSVAAALSSKQSGRVGLLINLNTKVHAIHEIEVQYLNGVIVKGMEMGIDIITFFFSMFENKTVEEVIRYLSAQSISGLIVFGVLKDNAAIHQLINSGIFKVVVADVRLKGNHLSSVWLNQEKAQYEVAKKTIEENSGKQILYIAGGKQYYVTEQRLSGIYKLSEELELDLTVRDGGFSELQAREITFAHGEAADIIVCASDLMAIGAMHALQEMDIFRPICGFDGLAIMGYAGKQMNTVKQDFSEMAAAAVTEIQYLLNGGEGREIMVEYAIAQMQYLDVIG